METTPEDKEFTREERQLVQAVNRLGGNMFRAKTGEENKTVRTARLTRHLVNEIVSIEECRGTVRVEGVQKTVLTETIS